MAHHVHLRRIPDLVDALLEAPDEDRRDQVLLSAVFRLRAAQAASLWRRVPGPGNGIPRWLPVLEHGPADVLPSRIQIEGFLGGGYPFTLPFGGRVLRAAGNGPPLALALGGRDPEDETVDALEALLFLRQQLDPAENGVVAPLDALQALLPQEILGDLPPEPEDEDLPLGSEDEAA